MRVIVILQLFKAALNNSAGGRAEAGDSVAPL